MSNDIEIQTPSFQELEISQGNSYSLSEIRQPKQQQPRLVWLFVDTICLGAVGLAILCFKLAVPPYRRGFYCDDDSINKPYKDSTVPSSVLYSVGFALAYLVAAVTEWYNYRHKKRSGMESCDEVYFKLGPVKLNSLLTELLRLYLSFAFGGLITVFVTDVGKYTVGRLRPHFLSICKAPPSIFINCSHNYILDDVCTGDPDLLREGRLSFPSGHASFSAYAVTFTILYMEAKIHFPHSKFLKFFLQLLVAQLGILCSLSRVSDYKHHWSDVLAGLLLGVLIALLTVDRVLQMLRKENNSRKLVDEGMA